MRRILRSKATLVLMGTLIGFFTAELLTRLILPQIGWKQFKYDLLGWASKEYINFDPLNDNTPRNVKRVMVLGDSFLAGSGVSNLNQRFPVVLEKKYPSRIKVQILAAGAWGTDQELLAFIRKGRLWKPNLVIVAFCATNDLSDILNNIIWNGTVGKSYFTVDKSGNLKLFNPQGIIIGDTRDNFNPQKHRRIFQSYFLDLLRYVSYDRKMQYYRAQREKEHNMPIMAHKHNGFTILGDFTEEIDEEKTEFTWPIQNYATKSSAYIHEDFKVNRYQWKLLESILGKFKQETDSIGAYLVVMPLPVQEKVSDLRFVTGGEVKLRIRTPAGSFTFRVNEPVDRLKAICKRKGINLFDPTKEFVKIVEDRDLFLKCYPPDQDRYHFSYVAHEILAELLQKYLLRHPEFLKRQSTKLSDRKNYLYQN